MGRNGVSVDARDPRHGPRQGRHSDANTATEKCKETGFLAERGRSEHAETTVPSIIEAMATFDSFEAFSSTGIVSGMSPEQVKVLFEAGALQEFAEGEALVGLEDGDSDLMVVLSGKCEIRTGMDDVLYALGPGSLIGEMSFFDHKPRSAKAIAIGECAALRFPASLLDDLETSRPDIAARLLKNIGLVLCQKLRSTTRFAEASFV